MENNRRINTNLIEESFLTLKPGQKLELSGDGTVIISWRDSHNKRKTFNKGNIYKFMDEIIPLNSKSFATAYNTPQKRFYGMDKQPRNVKMPMQDRFMVGFYLFLLDTTNEKDKKYYRYNKSISVFYNVIEINDYKGFYKESGKLEYIVTPEKEIIYTPILIEELKTESLAVCCFCEGYFLQNKISLYKVGLDKVDHVCSDCKKLHPEIHEVVIK